MKLVVEIISLKVFLVVLGHGFCSGCSDFKIFLKSHLDISDSLPCHFPMGMSKATMPHLILSHGPTFLT